MKTRTIHPGKLTYKNLIRIMLMVFFVISIICRIFSNETYISDEKNLVSQDQSFTKEFISNTEQ